MKLRTQLVLACFLLSVLPLTGIVVYSYHASRRALEGAYHHEASRMAGQMDRRVGALRAELDQSLAQVSTLPLQNIPTSSDSQAQVVDNILSAMGDSASLVDTLEFLPARPPVPAVAPAPQAEVATRQTARETPRAQPAPAVVAAAPVAPVAAPSTPDIAPPPSPATDATQRRETFRVMAARGRNGERVQVNLDELQLEPIVIELPPRPKMPKFTFTPEQKEWLSDVTRLSQQLAQNDLPAEQRAALQKELGEKQARMHASLEETRTQFEKELQAAQAAMRAHDQLREQMRTQQRQQKEAQRELDNAVTQSQRDVLTRSLQATAVEQDRLRELIKPAPAEEGKKRPKPAGGAVVVKSKSDLTQQEKAKLVRQNEQAGLLFGKRFNIPVHSSTGVIGSIRANISTKEVVRRILGNSSDERNEITFALDREGNLYTRNDEDRRTIERLGIPQRVREGKSLRDIENWIVVVSKDVESGLRVCVARPVGENLEELRKTAAQNFVYGLCLVGFALIGIIPLANHVTRDVQLVATGAERIAQGDLMTRLPVRSKNEFGQLAASFNRMAEDLSHHQQRIVEQERARKEQELQQRLLSIEYERKSVDLEEARRFQLSMLPKDVPTHERYQLAVFTRTATEVGGDYYDFHEAADGTMTVAIGDATGHGAKAGTMVTVIKTLFAGYSPDVPPSAFLGDAAGRIKRMELGRMSMALSIARFEPSRIIVSSAGMPPVLVHRAATGAVDEITLNATPLGTLGVEYGQRETSVATGDTVLLMSDGFPELQNESGQQLGYSAALQEFATAASAPTADAVIATLAHSAKQWHGDQPPNDDITFVVVRVL